MEISSCSQSHGGGGDGGDGGDGGEGEGGRFYPFYFLIFSLSSQIEKIMTLIGAGIDFSRDQQYATPGTVLNVLLSQTLLRSQVSSMS